MKILFYPIVDKSKIITKAQNCDYMVDCLAHGFANLNEDVEFYTDMPHWYKDYDSKSELYGRGFTVNCLLNRDQVKIADDVYSKIKNNYYDYIIYPIHNNLYKNDEVFKIIGQYEYGPDLRPDIVCGNDDDFCDPRFQDYGQYYKRENTKDPSFAKSIGFAIPEEKIFKENNLNKDKIISDIIPQFGGPSTYKFNTEEEYYAEYKRSWFAYTWKKGGWDCMRHYEILANACIPLFRGIHQVPPYCLGDLPKTYLKQIIEEYPFLGNNQDWAINTIAVLLTYTRKYLTTKKLAENLVCPA